MNLSNIIDVFRFGHQVKNPDTWKNVGTASPMIALAVDNVLKLAEAHGYALNLTPELHNQLILAVAGVVLFVVHLISSRKAGILPAKPGDGVLTRADGGTAIAAAGGGDTGGGQGLRVQPPVVGPAPDVLRGPDVFNASDVQGDQRNVGG